MPLVPIKPLLDRTPAGAWLEELRRWCRRNTILDSPDVRAEHSEQGTALFVNRRAGQVAQADTPLNHAVYDSTRDVIFGARGGYLFKFDTSGNIIASQPYGDPGGDASLLLDPDLDRIVVTHWWDPNIGQGVSSPLLIGQGGKRKGLYIFNPDTLDQVNFVHCAGATGASTTGAITPNPIPCNYPITTESEGFVLWFDLAEIFPIKTVAGPFVPDGSAYEIDPYYGAGDEVQIGPFDVDVFVQGLPPTGQYPAGNVLEFTLSGLNASGVLPTGNTLTVNARLFVPAAPPTDPPLASLECGVFAGDLRYLFKHYIGTTVQAEGAYYDTGPRRIVRRPSTGRWFIVEKCSDGGVSVNMIRFNPADESFEENQYAWDLEGLGGPTSWFDLFLDDANNRLWVTNGRHLTYFDDPEDFLFGSTHDIQIYGYSSGVPIGCVSGMDFCPDNGKLYCVTASSEVATVLTSSPFTVDKFTVPATAPRRIRYAATNVGTSNERKRLYIPTLTDNTVLELDPTTNSVIKTYTGFDVPYDIVSTPTAVWAVQQGRKALRRVI